MKLDKFTCIRIVKKIIRRKPLFNLVLRFWPKLITIVESRLKFSKDVELALLPVLCDKEKTSLDVGVLWGAYTLEMKKYSRSVICFEPNARMYRHLKRVFAPEVLMNNVALSDYDGKAVIRIPSARPGNATIESDNKLEGLTGIHEIEVRTATLDSQKIENIGFIKIDVEGHEISVLKGMVDVLKTSKPNILVEIEERHRSNSVKEVNSFFDENDYDVVFVKDKAVCGSQDLKKDDQDTSKRGTEAYIKNFIGIHKSKSKALRIELTCLLTNQS
ncbi:MAG: FkbM family methyltransferase [Psychroserpens sp.]|jgi:FkbM family methyltransferase